MCVGRNSSFGFKHYLNFYYQFTQKPNVLFVRGLLFFFA